MQHEDKRSSPSIPIPGLRFANRYLIIERIGAGGMGEVFSANDELLNNMPVALKVLKSGDGATKQDISRFLVEAQCAKEMSHENVVRTYDAVRMDETIFLVMEHLEGLTLKDCFNENEPLTIPQALPILIDIAAGLEYIYTHKVIHRDIKPSNIMLTRSGRAKIMDFGVAKAKVSNLTGQNEIVGSAPYLAPEVWSGTEAKHTADIYAFGVLAYEITTGRLPFQAKNPAEMMYKHIRDVPTRPMLLNPSIPLWLDQLIMQILAKEAYQRPQLALNIKNKLQSGLLEYESEVINTSVANNTQQELNLFSRHMSAQLLPDIFTVTPPECQIEQSTQYTNITHSKDISNDQESQTNYILLSIILLAKNSFALVFCWLTFIIFKFTCDTLIVNLNIQNAGSKLTWSIYLLLCITLALLAGPAVNTLMLTKPIWFDWKKKLRPVSQFLFMASMFSFAALTFTKLYFYSQQVAIFNLNFIFFSAADNLSFVWQKIADFILLSPFGVIYSFKTSKEVIIIERFGLAESYDLGIHLVIYAGIMLIAFKELRKCKTSPASRLKAAGLALLFFTLVDFAIYYFVPDLTLNLANAILLTGTAAQSIFEPTSSWYYILTAPIKWTFLLLILRN